MTILGAGLSSERTFVAAVGCTRIRDNVSAVKKRGTACEYAEDHKYGTTLPIGRVPLTIFHLLRKR